MKKTNILCLTSKNVIENKLIEKMFSNFNVLSSKEIMYLKTNEINQIIIYGVNNNSLKLIDRLIKIGNIKIKVITDIYEGVLFNHKDKDNYLKILRYLKENKIYKLYFLKKGIYEAYRIHNYNVGYIMPNYIVDNNKYINNINDKNKFIIGAYKNNFNWNNNTINTLSIARFFDNSLLFYNVFDDREKEFLSTFKIENKPLSKFKTIENYLNYINSSSIVLDIEFTNNFNLNFMLSAELKIPCLLGNNNDFFNNLNFKYKDIFITSSEDNPYLNSIQIEDMLKNKKLTNILEELYIWKQKYNDLQKNNIKKVIED